MATTEFPAEAFDNEVLYKVDQHGVAVITLNAPKRMNTMSKSLHSGVLCALEMAEADPAVAVVIFTGAGDRAFCAGGNLQPDESGQSSASAGMRVKGAVPPTVSSAVRSLKALAVSSILLREISKPTVCAVNGACAGAGFSWACACDLRFASSKALFRTAFLTAGLSGDFGGTWTLPRIVGPAKAREMYFLNRKVGAEEAQRIGLVTDVFPAETFMADVMQIARGLAAQPALALRRIKANLNDADSNLCFEAAITSESQRHVRCGFHPDAKEAGMAFLARRPAQFTSLKGEAAPLWTTSKL